jgi:sodium transport system permease protein
MRGAWAVFRKELVDALRDRRTLLMVLLTSVAVGPLALLLVSTLVGDLERQAEQRVVLVDGAERAPTLVNFIERQSFRVETAPADYEERLRAGRLGDAVLVVPGDFEAFLGRGVEPATLEVLGSGGHSASVASTRRVVALARAFGQEQAQLRQAMRGVASLPPVLDVQERDLSSRRSRSAQLAAMVPFFVLMAVLYGAMAAAMDTTAGEHERGSLEPLLMTPVPRLSLVLGKWAAVAAVGMLIALLSCVSFLPAQSLMRSETLAAMFHFGAHEAGVFLVVLLPFAAACAAVMMAVAIRAKSFKEAQVNNTGLVLAMTAAPVLSLLNQGKEAAWHVWVPSLGQVTLMNRVLQGESLGSDAAAAFAACLMLVVLGLWALVRSINRANSG